VKNKDLVKLSEERVLRGGVSANNVPNHRAQDTGFSLTRFMTGREPWADVPGVQSRHQPAPTFAGACCCRHARVEMANNAE
jgi:hypothetical protein